MTPSLTWPLILMATAILLLVLEMFIPSGGLLAVLCGLSFTASVIAAFIFGGLAVGTVFMAFTALLFPLLIYLAIKFWPKTPIGKRILIPPRTEEQILPENLINRQQWIGQHGKAVTPMLPSGAIRIGHQTLVAISDGLTIEKGTAVEVHAIRGNHLIVRPSAESPAPESHNHALDEVIPDPFDDSLS